MAETSEVIQIGHVPTTLGDVWIAASGRGVRMSTVPGATREECMALVATRSPAARIVEGGLMVEKALREMSAYFEGALREFHVPLDLLGTPFQQRVWTAVYEIPYGETASYGEIAVRIGQPNAFRAVGAANGANPAAIIVPCHRLVGSRGDLVKYGGGLERKKWLLDFEEATGGA